MIKVENLTKRYAGQVAIQGLNFEVGKGEIMGFLGPNGAGKRRQCVSWRVSCRRLPAAPPLPGSNFRTIAASPRPSRLHAGKRPALQRHARDGVSQLSRSTEKCSASSHFRTRRRCQRALRFEGGRKKNDRCAFERLPATRWSRRCARARTHLLTSTSRPAGSIPIRFGKCAT